MEEAFLDPWSLPLAGEPGGEFYKGDWRSMDTAPRAQPVRLDDPVHGVCVGMAGEPGPQPEWMVGDWDWPDAAWVKVEDYPRAAQPERLNPTRWMVL